LQEITQKLIHQWLEGLEKQQPRPKDVCMEHDSGLVDPLNTFAKTEMSHDGRAPA